MSSTARPLVSVIMPAYNAEAHIATSIRSVQSQTYENWELIVVDDGSTDRTAEIARGFSAADGRVRYFSQPNGGQGRARNAGIRQSGGQLIAFLDADDLWIVEKLSHQVELMRATGADLVFSDAFIFTGDQAGDDVTTFSDICPGFISGGCGGPALLRLLFEYNKIPVLTVLARADALRRVGLFAEERKYQNCEDYDLWIRLAADGITFYGTRERMAWYRRHQGSMMNQDSRLLKPMVAVVRRHSTQPGLERGEAARTVRALYRQLISVLIKEGKIQEAKNYLRELAAWDGGGLTTGLQKMLLAVAPGMYDPVSRECLYRAEWHAAKLFGRLKG